MELVDFDLDLVLDPADDGDNDSLWLLDLTELRDNLREGSDDSIGDISRPFS